LVYANIKQNNSLFLGKREGNQRNERVTPEFGGYSERNFIPQTQGVTNLTPLIESCPRDSKLVDWLL
jgi:hypothetical protein